MDFFTIKKKEKISKCITGSEFSFNSEKVHTCPMFPRQKENVFNCNHYLEIENKKNF